MKLDNYFHAERKNYIFYSLFPMLPASEVSCGFLFMEGMTGGNLAAAAAFFLLFGFLPALCLSLIQGTLEKKFLIQLLDLSEEQLIDVEDAASVCKMGNLIVTKDVLITYGIFDRKIVPLSSIREAALSEGAEYIPGRPGIRIIKNSLMLKKMSGETIYIKCPALYKGTEGKTVLEMVKRRLEGKEPLAEQLSVFYDYTVNPPHFCLFLSVFLGILLFLAGSYETVKYGNPPLVADAAVLLLFYTGYSCFYFIGAIFVLLTALGIMMLLKYRYIRTDWSDWVSRLGYGILFALCFFCLAAGVGDGCSRSAIIARTDYRSYVNGQQETAACRLHDKSGGGRNMEWFGLEAIKAAERFELEPECYEIEGRLFLTADSGTKIEEGEEYEIAFLENTRLITGFYRRQEVDRSK